MTQPELQPMTIQELSEHLGVSRTTILHNRKDHPLYSKAFQIGGKTSALRWNRVDVDNYLLSQREGSTR